MKNGNGLSGSHDNGSGAQDPHSRQLAYARKALSGEAGALAATKEGRNNRATAAARRLGNLIGANLLSFAECEAALREACRRNGLWQENPNGTAATICSNLKEGIKTPARLNPIGQGGTALNPRKVKDERGDKAKVRQRQEALARGAAWWSEAKPLTGTIGAAYLEETRGLPLPDYDEARFHPGIFGKDTGGRLPALLFPIRTAAQEASAIGYLRIFLQKTQPLKAAIESPKQILGRQEGGGVWFGDAYCETLLVAEGVENALSAIAAGYRFAVAGVSSGNLAKLTLPDHVAEIILAADRGADGEKFAKRAALAFQEMERRVLLALPPELKKDNGKHKDWNDLLLEHGAGGVRAALDAAAALSQDEDATSVREGWPELLSYEGTSKREPYPLDALPLQMREAVEEAKAFVKAPLEMIATSAITSLSLAAQALANVQRAERLSGGIALYTLILADSGERKSTVDLLFTAGIRAFETEAGIRAEPLLAAHRAKYAAWKAGKEGYEAAIRHAARDGKDPSVISQKLEDHESQEPSRPRIPELLRGDDTSENLCWGLAKEWPSAGVIQSEAGIIFGSHAMGSDKIMASLALLNILWDGTTHKVGRRTSESFIVENARLTVGLQVQESTLRAFCVSKGELARGIGFFARFLFVRPQSTQGTRFFADAPEGWPKLAAFERRLIALLESTPPLDGRGRLQQSMLLFDDAARIEWIELYDAIEHELGEGKSFFDVRDVAAKAADNIARLAALFHIFEHGAVGQIGARMVQAAGLIVLWHLHEAKSFFCDFALPAEIVDARLLEDWLLSYTTKHKPERLLQRTVQQLAVPKHLRQRETLDTAIEALSELGRAKLVMSGKQKIIELRPSLVKRSAP
jgi:putative DNA primase/helicase